MYNEHAKTYTTIPLAKPVDLHARHPLRHKMNHDKLLEYLTQRLKQGKAARDSQLRRFVRSDRDVSAWLALSDEDRARERVRETNGRASPTEMKLPLSFVHLDDMMTYYAEIFAPNRGMFYNTGEPSEQAAVRPVTQIMNNHAIYSGYYREVLRNLWCLFKYNRGILSAHWEADKQYRYTDSNPLPETRWEGNRVKAADPYNFLYDSTCPFESLHCEGEFAATVTLRSHFYIQNAANRAELLNCERALEEGEATSGFEYYIESQTYSGLAALAAGAGREAKTNWVDVLTGDSSQPTTQRGYEEVDLCIRLNPNDFELIQPNLRKNRSRYETWRFKILNGKYIVKADLLDNNHGWLPFFTATVTDDFMGTSQKAVAEIIEPLQTFASFLMNLHVQTGRANLHGVTYYDPSMIDLSQVPPGEVAAKIPIKPRGQGRDVRTMVQTVKGELTQADTMNQLEATIGIIAQFFPTQAAPGQIASIDRAVDSQVAAVQQGANRRQQKTARLLDETQFRTLRFALFYNIVQYMTESAAQLDDYFTGKRIDLNLDDIRQSNGMFLIGQGLKAIDRMALVSKLQQIIFALIQAPNLGEQIDILAIVDWWTSLMDIDFDFKQFRKAPPQQTPAGPQVSGATGEPVNPATDPAQFTDPIFGSPPA